MTGIWRYLVYYMHVNLCLMIPFASIINQQLLLHKFHTKTLKITPTCFDLFWIIIRELCFSLLKLYCNIHNLIRFCKQGVVAACHVV